MGASLPVLKISIYKLSSHHYVFDFLVHESCAGQPSASLMTALRELVDIMGGLVRTIASPGGEATKEDEANRCADFLNSNFDSLLQSSQFFENETLSICLHFVSSHCPSVFGIVPSNICRTFQRFGSI